MATPPATRHVVAVPYPGRGHINPMLVVCRQLAAADSALTVTVVVTEEWHALLASAGVVPSLPERVRLATITNVLPSERGRGADPIGFIEAVNAKMGEPVERLLDRLMLEQKKPEVIVVDTYLTWGVAAGARRGIPVCSLWTMPATFFLALYHMDQWPPTEACEAEEGSIAILPDPKIFDAKKGQSSKSLDQYVPFPVLSSVKCSYIKIFRSWELSMKRAAEAFLNVRKAQCVLFTSFYELEAYAINLDEIAMGLHDSAVSFFWVARDKATTNSLQQIAGHKGLVVPWCDQLKVLCHPAVGGFLSHCGWNSILEAVFAGVPLLAFPIVWDQLVNGRLVADEWKIGINLREDKKQGW
ncbi:hypothetical protein PR202_ga09323 [Eleusine coracana subsp. coracana]|uniref:UDP-glycosyltransferases domain-containing protein n=1 Tax=Eleusine coracana subsp. coracana TaxID=191504 RepID=A0AAV5C296_ELECO|nr:hypothetical protein PR202_ga09323 [Eleusine coracana subsp. coracana]